MSPAEPPQETRPTVIEARGLVKAFGSHTVLKGLDLDVARGEFVVVLGPSGAGKSTLLRCLNGLYLPTSGTVSVAGIPITRRRLSEVRKRVGFIFQNFNLIGNVSVLQNVLIGRLADKSSWSVWFTNKDRAIAFEALESVGLSEKAWAKADTLSGGQKQRVGIARALAHAPEVLLADEPISNLDPRSGRDVLSLLRSLNRERGTTVMCNLHAVDEALRVADRIVGLGDGQVRFNVAPSEYNPDIHARIYGIARDRREPQAESAAVPLSVSPEAHR